MNKKTHGFSLIELMLVAAIIGIIAAIAYPSYVDSVRESRRGEAVSALLELAVAQERFRAGNTSYTNNLTQFGYTNLNGAGDDGADDTEVLGSGFYQVQVVSATAIGFELKAVEVSGTDQANDGCNDFVITHNGPDYSAGNADQSCWN